MALAATGSAQGDPKTYQIGSALKRFTLIDLGFVQTKNGNFQLQRRAMVLKRLTFSKPMPQKKMSSNINIGSII